MAAARAAASGTSNCPRAALFFSLTLLGVKEKLDFTPTLKIAFKNALMRMAPGTRAPATRAAPLGRCAAVVRFTTTAARHPTGATILPVAIEHNDLGQTVHAVALFPGDVPAGVRAAQALAAKLRAGGLNAHFDVKRFGRVHPEVIAEPYLVSRRAGGKWAAALDTATQPAWLLPPRPPAGRRNGRHSDVAAR